MLAGNVAHKVESEGGEGQTIGRGGGAGGHFLREVLGRLFCGCKGVVMARAMVQERTETKVVWEKIAGRGLAGNFESTFCTNKLHAMNGRAKNTRSEYRGQRKQGEGCN